MEKLATSGHQADHPGSLFYLMGPSGSGKDSLLEACRGRVVEGRQLRIAQRCITRSSVGTGEEHISLTEEEFSEQLKQGTFAMHWSAHGQHYGIRREIDQWLAGGHPVLVNGSRAYLEQAQARYPPLVPVLVRVDPHQLRLRLEQRGRDSAAEIEARLRRSGELEAALSGDCPVIANNGGLGQATDQLISVIRQHLVTQALPCA